MVDNKSIDQEKVGQIIFLHRPPEMKLNQRTGPDQLVSRGM